jgi:hypothetical protein
MPDDSSDYIDIESAAALEIDNIHQSHVFLSSSSVDRPAGKLTQDAANVAYVTLRRPFRIAIHGSELITLP